MTARAPLNELTAAESAFLTTMRRLGFGRFECLQVRNGQIVLDPWPVAVRDIKFAAAAGRDKPGDTQQALRPQVAEFFSQVRSLSDGEIRELVVHHGIPFSMELDLSPTAQFAEECCRG